MHIEHTLGILPTTLEICLRFQQPILLGYMLTYACPYSGFKPTWRYNLTLRTGCGQEEYTRLDITLSITQVSKMSPTDFEQTHNETLGGSKNKLGKCGHW